MNQFVALSALLAVAAAAPSADPYLVYAAPFLSAHAKTDDLVTHANGAVVPSDTVSVQAAKAQHLLAKTLYGYPYGLHLIGKREAEPSAEADPSLLVYAGVPALVADAKALPVENVVDALSGQRQVKFGNGAVVPEEPLAVQLARGSHLTTKALTYAARGYYGLPYYGHHLIGKREAESNPEADPYLLYGGYHPFVTSVGGLTTYSNGAVVPTNTPAVQAATINHLAAKGAIYAARGYGYHHLLGKRDAESKADAEPYLLYGYHHPAAITSVGALTTYANGAVVPTNPTLLAAEAKHFAKLGYGYLWG